MEGSFRRTKSTRLLSQSLNRSNVFHEPHILVAKVRSSHRLTLGCLELTRLFLIGKDASGAHGAAAGQSDGARAQGVDGTGRRGEGSSRDAPHVPRSAHLQAQLR